MTTREEIIALAEECGFVSLNIAIIADKAVPMFEAFFQASQRQAYERAAGICEAVADGWDKNPGRNPQAGYVASSNCATEIRALIVQKSSGA